MPIPPGSNINMPMDPEMTREGHHGAPERKEGAKKATPTAVEGIATAKEDMDGEMVYLDCDRPTGAFMEFRKAMVTNLYPSHFWVSNEPSEPKEDKSEDRKEDDQDTVRPADDVGVGIGTASEEEGADRPKYEEHPKDDLEHHGGVGHGEEG